MIKNLSLILPLFFSVMPLTFAWNATGHKLVAEIAYLQLDDAKRLAVDRILNHDVVNSSTWADEVRAKGNDSMNSWHYINLPHPGPQKNVVDAIRDSEKDLNNPNHLRGLIHWVGDIHQPLHTVSRDRGGNAFYLVDTPYGKNLHQLWDNGAGVLWHVKDIKKTAAAWLKTYPASQQQLQEQNPMHWAMESYDLAVNQVYVNITPKTAPCALYIERARLLTQKQIVLAGTRLAQIINESKL